MTIDTMNPTKQDVINRLRPVLVAAVQNRTGISYLLSEAESLVFSNEDMAALMAETGYPPPALYIPARNLG